MEFSRSRADGTGLPDISKILTENQQPGCNSQSKKPGSSVITINDWVSAATKQKIPQILDNINSTDLLFLIIAVYFKGAWKYNFNKADTKNADFYKTGGALLFIGQINDPYLQ